MFLIVMLICADAVISVSVEIDSELSEAEGYLRAMDVEYRGMVASNKKAGAVKMAEYREEYKQLLQKFTVTKQKAESEALKSGPAARVKLVTANQRLDQSTATLENSRMLIAQTEVVGQTIMTDLEGQKETLQGAQSNVQETKQYTEDAKSVLTLMYRRAIMHNAGMMLIIVILFGVMCVIVYYGFVDTGKKK
jgi:vesicle transport through interaction with t-SNAREs protein 1